MMPERPVFGPPDRRDLHMGQRYTRWAIWGCGVVVLVGVLLFAGMLLVMARNPGLLRDAEHAQACYEHMDEVAGALQRYQKDKGKAPASLDDLYPTYLAKREYLLCPNDPTASTHTSYLIRPGVAMGTGSAVLAYCPHHPNRFTMGRPIAGGSNLVPLIRQDGSTDRVPMSDAELKALGGR
ncbi:MAG TPA: hypothetical protein VGM37_13835 [Armatimonadota bacterium]|jgi:hypothetical protein